VPFGYSNEGSNDRSGNGLPKIPALLTRRLNLPAIRAGPRSKTSTTAPAGVEVAMAAAASIPSRDRKMRRWDAGGDPQSRRHMNTLARRTGDGVRGGTGTHRRSWNWRSIVTKPHRRRRPFRRRPTAPLTLARGVHIVARMCTLILGVEVVASGSVLLAANRDEDPARPADPPGVLSESPRLVGGRDRRAGGTWLAVRERRAVVALLNR